MGLSVHYVEKHCIHLRFSINRIDRLNQEIADAQEALASRNQRHSAHVIFCPASLSEFLSFGDPHLTTFPVVVALIFLLSDIVEAMRSLSHDALLRQALIGAVSHAPTSVLEKMQQALLPGRSASASDASRLARAGGRSRSPPLCRK